MTNNPPPSLSSSTYSGIQFDVLVPFSSSTTSSSSNAGPTDFVHTLKTQDPERRPDGRLESRISYEYHFSSTTATATASSRPSSEQSSKYFKTTLFAQWSDFKPTYRGRPVSQPGDGGQYKEMSAAAAPLNPSALTELGWMCRSNFGKQQGAFELYVGKVVALARKRDSDVDEKSSLVLKESRSRSEGKQTWAEYFASWFRWIFRT